MELNACEIGHSRRQNLTRKRSEAIALWGRIKDAMCIAGPDRALSANSRWKISKSERTSYS
jgi:hypothetical protein